ncbi:unnamed protein product [Linum tenue]|uniref:Uncharacterized protein n=3 Tax=Linum tenue TaxID=586396 RepID=A0AAV0KJD4_9ROSI|nr:unnamed protein product [Linum tenue]
MQEKLVKPEEMAKEEGMEDLRNRLSEVEAERDRLRDELQVMKMVAEHANNRLTESMTTGRVADVFSELNHAVEALTISSEDLKIKEKMIQSLTAEVVNSKESQAKLVDDLGKAKSTEVESLDKLSKISRRAAELESELEKLKQSETKMIESLMEQTKQFEKVKIELEESKLEAENLRERLDRLEAKEESESQHIDYGISRSPSEEQLSDLKVELQAAKESLARAHKAETAAAMKSYGLVEENESLKIQLRKATEAEENSKIALDDLAMALKEVIMESKAAREKLIGTQGELEHYRREAEDSRERVRSAEERQRARIEEARREAEQYRNAAERLRLDAEESVSAWSVKEKGFVECIRKAEAERDAAVKENRRLEELMAEGENAGKATKQEAQNLRDIMKQALNEATAAKESAAIAQSENSQLKDALNEKDDALVFITKENESLRANEAAAQEKIKELKQKLAESAAGKTGKEGKVEEKDHKEKEGGGDHHQKNQKSHGGAGGGGGSESATTTSAAPPKEHARKLSSAFSFNLRELIIPSKAAKEAAEEQEKKDHHENEEFEDAEDFDPLKGSIFDVVESPPAPQPAAPKHQRKKSFTFSEPEHEAAAPADEFEHLEGDDLDGDKNNPRKKRALLRRFGEMITRRRGYHRKEPSMGGGGEGHKREPSLGGGGLDGLKKELSLGSEGQKKETPGGGEGHKREMSPALEDF